MEIIIDILVVLALLVWVIVGIAIIGYGIYYHKLMKPIMKPMVKLYQNMIDEELED